MEALIKWVLTPVVRYLWAMLCLPHDVRQMRHNDLAHLQLDVTMMREDLAEQKGVCKATRQALGLLDD